MENVLKFIPAELHGEATTALCNESMWAFSDVLDGLSDEDRKAAWKAAHALWKEWQAQDALEG